MTSATPAVPITKEQWSKAFKDGFATFEAMLGSHKLQQPLAVFNVLWQFANQVATLEPDSNKIAQAAYEQLKAHLLDRTSVGQQRQLEGRPLQVEDLVIRWVPGTEPPALTKWLPKHRASWIDEVMEREKESEEHADYLKAREAYEKARKACPAIIAEFQPVRNGRVDHASILRVTAALQKYLDGYEQQHQEDLAKLEADRTFRGWRVNWPSVLEKMREFANREYDKAEGRTPQSERL